jgi:nitrate reductase NapD
MKETRLQSVLSGAKKMNISSVVVHVLPNLVDSVLPRIEAQEGAEVHAASPEGRLIVTIECSSDKEAADAFEALRQMDGVLSATLIYTQTETDPYEEICDETDAA